MSYFANLGTTWYKFSNGETLLMNDLTKFATFRRSWMKDPRAHMTYQIKDGDLPHKISYTLYDTVNYWWIVLMINGIYNFEESWPRTSEQLDKYIADKYPFNVKNDVHHYIAPNGTITDLLATRIATGSTTDAEAISKSNLSAVSIYDYELSLNDYKRNIVLVDPDYVGLVASEFERLMKNG